MNTSREIMVMRDTVRKKVGRPSGLKNEAPAPTGRFRLVGVVGILLPVLCLTAGSPGYDPLQPPEDFEVPPPKSPAESREAIETPEGMRVELVAAEPLIVDPVAFDWGPKGRLWVVEMRDYPLGMDNEGKPGGRVKVLEDTDGDGQYDDATTFLDGLPYPTSVMAWRDGALVVAAPAIFYAEDTDDDGRADRRETLYRGFGEGNQQHRVNGLRWGLDNWIYLANGAGGGDAIRSEITGEAVNMRGRDLRLRPDEGLHEAASGRTQYNRNRDDWGNWFGNHNSQPAWHYLLPDHYLRRNPHVASPRPWQLVPENPGPARVYPASETLARFNDPDRANRFTSACSLMIYRDTLLGDAFAGNSFVCEPVHNLVHREIVERDGLGFTSRRAASEQASEFLASRDNWFRPSMVRTGPDGALWVADMYRFVIEHPEWIPPAWEEIVDLRAGEDRGRIYRVYPADREPRKIPRLDRLGTQDLTAKLDHLNGFVRDLAQRMLLWRGDDAAVEPLKRMAREHGNPKARLHALCTLDGLDALNEPLLLEALSDEHRAIRRHAVRLSEPKLNTSSKLAEAVLDQVDDEASKVRLQVAFSLGAWDNPQAGRAIGRILAEQGDNRYMAAAALSSATNHPHEALTALLDRRNLQRHRSIRRLLATAEGTGHGEAALDRLLAHLPDPETNDAPAAFGLAAELFDMLGSRDTPLIDRLDGQQRRRIRRIIAEARRVADDGEAPTPRRRSAVALLGRLPDAREADLKRLGGLLTPRTPLPLQRAAVQRLGAMRGGEVASLLLDRWPQAGPETRSAIFSALLSRERWIAALLDRIEDNPALANSLGARRRQQLLEHESESIRQRAADLLGGPTDADRREIVREYADKLADLEGDAERGSAVFERNCAVCHRIDDVGRAIGPDLTALSDTSTGALLTAILAPNRAVEGKYLSYVATMQDGRSFAGIIVSESGNSVTLAGLDGERRQLPRARIRSLTSTGRSLMPPGLEQAMSAEDLADLLAFLRAAGRDAEKTGGE